MIKKQFLIPEYYVHKIPMCDDCRIELQFTGVELPSCPPLLQHQCPKCGKVYTIPREDLQGEWKWRTL